MAGERPKDMSKGDRRVPKSTWWMALPGLLAIACITVMFTAARDGGDSLFSAQILLFSIGLGMAGFLPSEHARTKLFWIAIYSLAIGLNVFVILGFTYQCSVNRLCL